MIDLQSLFPELAGATITFTGEAITIVTRNRDSLSHELKKAMSHRTRCPMHFMFHTTTKFKQEWWYHGSLHNPFGGPSRQTITNTDYLEHYYNQHGQVGCDHGPALIEHHHGKSYKEAWIGTDGLYHRDDGPASIDIEYETAPVAGKTHFNERSLDWYQRGHISNHDSWAQQVDTVGAEIFEKTPDGFIRRLEAVTRSLAWYTDGVLQRTDGPAHIVFRGFKEIEKAGKTRWTWTNWDGYWYVRGKEIPTGKVLKWAKAASIKMWNEPCYDKPVFRNPEDEFLFITDFTE